MKRHILSFLFLASSLGFSANAQEQGGDVFQLTKTEGHYLFQTELNYTVPATVLVESGIHALLIDSLFAFEHQEIFDFKLRAYKKGKKMNLGGTEYIVSHRTKDVVRLGKHSFYEGEILIIPNYKSAWEVAVPIQYLYNDNDDRRQLIKLDLRNKQMRMLSQKEWRKERKDYKKEKMNFKSYEDMPAIETDLNLTIKGEERTLAGNFNIDLGNPEFLYLFHQSKDVQKFIDNNPDIKVRQVYNRKGGLIGDAISTERSEACGISIMGKALVITRQFPQMTTEGCIGVNFFERTVAVFDFDDSTLYLKK